MNCLEKQSLQLVYVVDADTQDFLVNSVVYGTRKERVRILEIDAWEMRGKERPKGIIARDAAIEWLTVTVPFEGHFWEKDSFGRWLIRLFKPGDPYPRSLAMDLLDGGHGIYVPFDLQTALIQGIKVLHELSPPSSVPKPKHKGKKHGMRAEDQWPSILKAEWIERESRRYGVDFDDVARIMTERDYVVEDE